jgi:hypothetical protein
LKDILSKFAQDVTWENVRHCLKLDEIGLPTFRVVVADRVPDVHAWEDGVGGWASLNGTSNLKGGLPDDLGEMAPVTVGLLRALLPVQVGKERGLTVPLLDDGILKSALQSPGT